MQTDWLRLDFSSIEVVSYDLGYTIIEPNYVRIAELVEHFLDYQLEPCAIKLAERRMALKSKQFCRIVNGHYANIICDTIRELTPGAGWDVAPQRFLVFYNACKEYQDRTNFFEIVYPDALAALELLKKAGKRVIVISNAGGTLERDLTRIGIRGYFEFIIDSGVEHVNKPDKEIFVRALDRAGAKAENALHIGDDPENDIRGALNAGLRTALYDPEGHYPEVDGQALHFRNHLDLAEKLIGL